MNILDELKAILDKDLPAVSNLSNASSVLNKLDNLNWVGFYLLDGDHLYLGPFQGEIACTKIKVGKGVCGTAVKEDRTLVVPNVNEFPGHIACSSLSKSEIVVPLHVNGTICGVLDIDSPVFDRFQKEDVELIEKAAKIIESTLCFTK